MRTAQIFRLKLEYRTGEFIKAISEASKYAKSVLGVPYDDPFILDNGKLYCSELLYECFKEFHIFDSILKPMTFKASNSDSFLPAWVEYYEKLGLPIPEGKLGLNPVSLSRSPKLLKL